MPAKKSAAKSTSKEKFIKFMVVFSILGNIFFIVTSISLGIFFNSKSSDFFILNAAFNRKGINYETDGNCLQISKDLADEYVKLDSKGRVLSQDGNKVSCIVEITPAEADAIQKTLDEQSDTSF
jgi:hypothetical protein